MTRRPSLAADSFFNGLSFVVRVLGTLLTLAWVARGLGPEGQGRFGFVNWLAATGAQVALWGLGPAATRFVARAFGASKPAEARAAVEVAQRWAVASVAVAAGVALPLVLAFGGELRDLLLVGIGFGAIIAAYQFRIGVAWGLRRFDLAFRGHLLFFAVLLPGIALGLRAGEPVMGVLLGFVAARLVHAVAMGLWTRGALLKGEPGPPVADPGALRGEVRGYAVQMAGVAICAALLWDRVELGFLKVWTDFAEMGLYTAAFGVSVLVVRVPGVLALVLVPLVAGLDGAGSPERIGLQLRRAARALVLLLSGPTAVALAAAPALVAVMYGPEYREAAPLLQILLVPLLLGGYGAAGAKTLIGSGHQAALLRVAVAAVVLKLVLCLALVPVFGVVGAAVACAVAQGGALFAEGKVAQARFHVDAPERWLRQGGVVLAAFAGAAAVGALIPLAPGAPALGLLALQVGVGGVAWVGSALLLKPLGGEDARRLASFLPGAARGLVRRM